MRQELRKDVTITSKGQLTLPVSIRRAWKLGPKRKVRLALTNDNAVTIRPLPDAMALFGALHSRLPRDPGEKHKARQAMGRRASRKS